MRASEIPGGRFSIEFYMNKIIRIAPVCAVMVGLFYAGSEIGSGLSSTILGVPLIPAPKCFSGWADVASDEEIAELLIDGGIKPKRHSFGNISHNDKKVLLKAFSIFRSGDQFDPSGNLIQPSAYSRLAAVHGVNSSNGYGRYRFPSEVGRSSVCECNHDSVASLVDEDVESDEKETIKAPLFLLWHRAYVQALEISLRDIIRTNKVDFPGYQWTDFSLPYWDWNELPLMPMEFRSRISLDEHGNATSQPVLGACLAGSGSNEYSNPLFHCSHEDASNKNLGEIGSLEGGNPFLDSYTMSEFSEAMFSGWHAQVHEASGKAMKEQASAAWDPIFFFHHANVDRLFDQWLVDTYKNKNLVTELKGDLSTYRNAWEKAEYSFPVLVNGKFKLYQPKWDDLFVVSGSFVADQSSYDELNFKSEGNEIIKPERILINANKCPDRIEPAKDHAKLGGAKTLSLSFTDDVIIKKEGLEISVPLTERQAWDIYTSINPENEKGEKRKRAYYSVFIKMADARIDKYFAPSGYFRSLNIFVRFSARGSAISDPIKLGGVDFFDKAGSPPEKDIGLLRGRLVEIINSGLIKCGAGQCDSAKLIFNFVPVVVDEAGVENDVALIRMKQFALKGRGWYLHKDDLDCAVGIKHSR